MRLLGAVTLAVFAVGLAGPAAGQDEAKKIVGKWTLEKSGGDLPVGSTVEFTEKGEMIANIKVEKEMAKVEGTYKIDKERLVVKLKIGDMTVEETVSILKLTTNELEVKDKDGKVDLFTKK